MAAGNDLSSLRHALDQAYRYLSIRARSIIEIRNYLSRKGHSEPVIEEAIKRLEDYGYVDDMQFAKQFVDSKDGWGSRRLLFELRRKGIDQAIIDEVMPGTSVEIERCRRLAVAYLRKLGPEPDQAGQRRLWSYLMRRGFSREAIESAIRWTDESQER